jgi:chromosome segregation protein
VEDAVRAAQAQANEQRNTVAQVQQQIQLLAADSRNIDDQARQLRARRDRLATERQGLQAARHRAAGAAAQQHAAAAELQETTDAACTS